MTDSETPPESDRPTRPVPLSKNPPKRLYLPWWGLTLIGAGIGFVTAEWIGGAFGALLGFFAWKLR